ncbi:1-aminocyclopropane-1-carboxylate oxidase -like protein [Capsicum annuum]|nr:1-aminocyclopropane-1-carboxylate oxidase -like protein [Capsicum annuum]
MAVSSTDDFQATIEKSYDKMSELKALDDTKAVSKDSLIQTWGFFQVVNHSIPTSVLDETLHGIRQFFEQDPEVKKQYYSQGMTRKKVMYTSNFDLYSPSVPAASWRDIIFCSVAPNPPDPQEFPTGCGKMTNESQIQDGATTVGATSIASTSQANALQPMAPAEKPKKFAGIDFKRGQQKMFFNLKTLPSKDH